MHAHFKSETGFLGFKPGEFNLTLSVEEFLTVLLHHERDTYLHWISADKPDSMTLQVDDGTIEFSGNTEEIGLMKRYERGTRAVVLHERVGFSLPKPGIIYSERNRLRALKYSIMDMDSAVAKIDFHSHDMTILLRTWIRMVQSGENFKQALESIL